MKVSYTKLFTGSFIGHGSVLGDNYQITNKVFFLPKNRVTAKDPVYVNLLVSLILTKS
ncbi:hypothetical protein SHDE107825_19010 [Shewanella denitrificans]